MKGLKFSEVEAGDIVSLNIFPFKPMKVEFKKLSRLRLETEGGPIRAGRWLSIREFESAQYIRNNEDSP